MDNNAEHERLMRQLKGLMQIEVACKTPLAPLKTVALCSGSFPALQTGLKPIHQLTHMTVMMHSGASLGFVGRR